MATENTAIPAATNEIVLLQDADNVIRNVRVNGTTFRVVNAGPVVLPAGLGVAMTVEGTASVEKAEAQG